MSSFMKVQIKRIDLDKWYEGCRINSDPGQSYVIDWISRNAHWFRDHWEHSCCKDCIKWQNCGYKVETSCENFLDRNSEIDEL